ncbi:MAG: CBS domain-containing protein [Promethearchaeota archaeon]
MNGLKKKFLVKDLVIEDEYGIIESTATVHKAAKKMKELGVPDLVVLDSESKEVLGIIADFDIVQNIVAEGIDCKTEKVVNVMYVIEPVNLDTPVEEAFTRMQKLYVNVVPVVESGELKGVCTIQDCWSFIPDETFDDIGMIPVENPKLAEFWFASTCTILALLLGVIFPMIGIYGFFYADQASTLSMLGSASIRGGILRFFPFEARGKDLLIEYSSLIDSKGIAWLFLDLVCILTIIFGILTVFTIIYASYSDARKIIAARTIRLIIPLVFLVFLILEWVVFGMIFSIYNLNAVISIDIVGLLFSIVSMILVILSIFRNYIFRGKETAFANKEVNT